MHLLFLPLLCKVLKLDIIEMINMYRRAQKTFKAVQVKNFLLSPLTSRIGYTPFFSVFLVISNIYHLNRAFLSEERVCVQEFYCSYL